MSGSYPYFHPFPNKFKLLDMMFRKHGSNSNEKYCRSSRETNGSISFLHGI